MTSELSALATLLLYPRHQLIADLARINHVLQTSKHINAHSKETLSLFIKALSAAPLTALQNVYLASFEKENKLNLAEREQKGRAALKCLEDLYRKHGQKFDASDVPDFLPAILEFLSTLSFSEALVWIKNAKPVFEDMDRKLLNISSPWLAVSTTLLTMGETEDAKAA